MLYHITERNRDLIRAIKREIAACGKNEIDLEDVLDRAVNGGAPRFYVAYDTALDTMRRYFRCGTLRTTGRRRTRQWLEMASMVRALMESNGAIGLAGAVARVLYDGKPSGFFLTRRQAYGIYNEYLRYANNRA